MNRRDRLVITIGSTMALVLSSLVALKICDTSAIRNDGAGYVALGYNLVHHGVFSLDKVGQALTPSNYREPLYPAYLALTMAAIPGLRQSALGEFFKDGDVPRSLKLAQYPLLILCAVASSILAWKLTSNSWASVGAMALVLFSPSLNVSCAHINSEHLAALLVLLLSWALFAFVRSPGFGWCVVVGCSAGLLVLTKGVFQYLLPLLPFALMAVMLRRLPSHKVRAMVMAIIIAVVSFGLAGIWMLRNAIQFGEWKLAGRGGVILLIRAEKDMMTLREWGASFLYWVPYDPVRRALVMRIFGNDAMGQGGVLERLNRENDTSYYRTARRLRSELSMASKVHKEDAGVDAELKKLAFAIISAHPYRHLAVTLPVAWRGLFVEGHPALGPAALFTVFLSLGYFASFWIQAMRSIVHRNAALMLLMLPVGYLYLIQTLMTYNLPRFNVPAIPVLAVILTLSINQVCRHLRTLKVNESGVPWGGKLCQ